jgi:hypothetical protein
MNAVLLSLSAAEGKPTVDPVFSTLEWCGLALGIFILIYTIIKIPSLFAKFQSMHEDSNHTAPTPKRPTKWIEPAQAPKGNELNLNSVGISFNRESASPIPAPSAPVAPPAPKPPAVSVGPGEFEKALAHAGQRMDTLTAQAEELNRQLKLAEKARTETAMSLRQSTDAMARQLEQKDVDIAKLAALLDQKSSYPSLRALIEVKKLAQDLKQTQKPLTSDGVIDFIAGSIDEKLLSLELLTLDFAAGTPLEKIPGEQIESANRFEPTTEATKVNQVARTIRPCYYFEKDSKKIIVAKAILVFYRLQPPADADAATSTPHTK